MSIEVLKHSNDWHELPVKTALCSGKAVRLWALARGKRVYALTTNVNLFGLIALPEKLRADVAALPER